MGDVDELKEKLHAKGMKLVLDLVLLATLYSVASH